MKKIHKYIIKSKLSIREVIKHMSDSDIEITVCVNDKNKGQDNYKSGVCQYKKF